MVNEKSLLAQNLTKEHSAGKARIDMESINDTLLQAETTDLAFSISKFFDKKLKPGTEPLNIYLTKCPCRRCQTLRRINRFTSNH